VADCSVRPAMSDVEAEFAVLSTEPGKALLDAVGASKQPGPAEMARWRTQFSMEIVSAGLRLVEARRRARVKFSRADELWLNPIGVEQATSELVARHKARRFAGAEVVADLCSGIGADSLALASVGCRVVAVDLDLAMTRRLNWNAAVHGFQDQVLAVRARAETAPIRADSLIHIDPDRRTDPTRRRARDLADYQPALPWLLSLIHRAPGGAIKLGPASDFAQHFGSHDLEIELVSLNGECKEATVWFGELAGECRRRATTLPAGVSISDLDFPDTRSARVCPLGDWIFDPDPALLRAGLLDALSVQTGLGRVAQGVDYLTGTERVFSPFLTPFSVIAELPLDVKRLRREVATRSLGPLEIKVRGLSVTPERLRRELNPPGPNLATLLLYPANARASAILARRVD
jgi:THUMP domain-like